MRWICAALLVLFCACRHPAYTLAVANRAQLLTPPASKPEIKAARSHPSRKQGCDVEAESFSVTWHGNTARVAMKPEAYYAPPAPTQSGNSGPITISESGPRIYVDSIAQLDKFRQSLEEKEDAGCLRGDEAVHLRQSITEKFPFPPGVAVYLRFGPYTRTSYFDLTPEFMLRLVPPATNPQPVLYSITRAADDDRMSIKLVSGPGTLKLPERPAYLRYLYRTSGSDHNFLATILGAPDRAALREATGVFLTNPDKLCATPPAGVSCLNVSAGMNAGFHVRINGQDSFVRLGGTVAEALSDAQSDFHAVGQARALPHVQSLRRMFRGKPIPVRFQGNEIFALVMMPGDEIIY